MNQVVKYKEKQIPKIPHNHCLLNLILRHKIECVDVNLLCEILEGIA